MLDPELWNIKLFASLESSLKFFLNYLEGHVIQEFAVESFSKFMGYYNMEGQYSSVWSYIIILYVEHDASFYILKNGALLVYRLLSSFIVCD